MDLNYQPQDHLRRRVLVVDDEASIRAILIHFLEQEHFEVQAAQDGLAALKACDTEHFDIILVDLHMPGMSGLETAAAMRQRYPALPIALVTAMASTLDTEAVIRAGISQVFAKPFDIKELASWLKSVRSRE
jgi:DNA-binding response OmpR family regulator